MSIDAATVAHNKLGSFYDAPETDNQDIGDIAQHVCYTYNLAILRWTVWLVQDSADI